MDDRRGKSNIKDKYFLLYHIEKNVFALEGYGLELIKDIVNNLPLEGGYKIREPYSIVMKLLVKRILNIIIWDICNLKRIKMISK